ncbi:hypothetical protein ATANTOWER_030020 [Ataeniobius toweri]|uniref:Uncharacterized protein n=1 Tax=Ataeniobius toweri TaxID=208326 RepID=A0ABU7BU46_9TELE|nr:hypothetical protein [Ataeniobius toweri]
MTAPQSQVFLPVSAPHHMEQIIQTPTAAMIPSSCHHPRPGPVLGPKSLLYLASYTVLHTGNNEFSAHGTVLSPTPKTRSNILEGLAEEIMKYTAYPKDEQLEDVTKALIQPHPCLLEKGTRSGYCGWKHYFKIKIMNFRSKLRYVFYLMGSISFPSEASSLLL